MVSNKELVEKARKVRNNSYCEYSGFQVGAALLTRDGNVFVGVNVENINFNSTIHAEGSCISSAVAQGYGVDDFEAIAVSCDEGFLPCGRCRQTLSEFQDEVEISVIVDDGDDYRCVELSEIFPGSMDKI